MDWRESESQALGAETVFLIENVAASLSTLHAHTYTYARRHTQTPHALPLWLVCYYSSVDPQFNLGALGVVQGQRLGVSYLCALSEATLRRMKTSLPAHYIIHKSNKFFGVRARSCGFVPPATGPTAAAKWFMFALTALGSSSWESNGRMLNLGTFFFFFPYSVQNVTCQTV